MTNDELSPCPFCSGVANFDHDDNGWNWIECSVCGASTNARVSAMDDCKPLLAESWNRRATDAELKQLRADKAKLLEALKEIPARAGDMRFDAYAHARSIINSVEGA